MRTAAIAVLALSVTATPLPAQDLASKVASQFPGLIDTYNNLHAHPELSHHEQSTASLLAAELRKAGYRVTEHIDRYPDGSPAFGVMHACGHDVHTTTLIGTARALAALQTRWRGTRMLLGQPAEETIDGAKAMLADHLYERFGTPDMAIALHDTYLHAAGTVGVPEDRMPIVTVRDEEYAPVLFNDPALTARVKSALVNALGGDKVVDDRPIMGSEDFGNFGLDGRKIPVTMFWLGAMDPEKFAAAEAAGKFLPGMHTSRFEPLPEPTLKTGVTAVTAAAQSLLGP